MTFAVRMFSVVCAVYLNFSIARTSPMLTPRYDYGAQTNVNTIQCYVELVS